MPRNRYRPPPFAPTRDRLCPEIGLPARVGKPAYDLAANGVRVNVKVGEHAGGYALDLPA